MLGGEGLVTVPQDDDLKRGGEENALKRRLRIKRDLRPPPTKASGGGGGFCSLNRGAQRVDIYVTCSRQMPPYYGLIEC